MDRYYSILGIPNNSSKEVIKSAYHSKMKALHPDKIHGTPLEDTATFFTKEINEAYSSLMAQFSNSSNTNSSSQKSNQPSFIEEDIYIDGKGYLHYTLSNNINTIVNEIYNRVRCKLPDTPSQIPWMENPVLSPNVKKSMNNHNYKYSMTSYFEGSLEYVIINKKSGNNWYCSGYEINPKPKNNINNNSEYKNNTNSFKQNYNYSKQRNPFWVFIKIVIAVIIFVVIFQQCNGTSTIRNQPQANTTKSATIYATVRNCDWLNVRRTPSSINNNNIIEAIRVNTRVEIISRSNNGWVQIRYGNSKTGYVHTNFLRE